MLRWHANQDGSFALDGGAVSISGAYPSIDGIPVHPIAVNVRGDDTAIEIQYSLEVGTLELNLQIADGVAIATCKLHAQTAPGTVEILGRAQLTGLARAFKQGRGMCGGSGLVDLSKPHEIESFELFSLLSEENSALTMWCADCRRFESTFSLTAEEEPRLTARFRTEGIPLPDGVLALPPLKFAENAEMSASIRAAASDVALTMGARPIRPASYHWCSWYYLYHNLDMTILAEYLQGLNSMTPRPELDFFQIDAGYFPSLGDWLRPSVRFPNGLEEAFDLIRSNGYKPGIWVGPFMVGNRSRLATEHPDWLLRDVSGQLVTPWRGYGEPKTWGYRDEETYVLDSSHPEAFEYLRVVFRTLRGWGAEMFKTDFMYWGYQDSQQVRRHTPGKTSVEYFRDVLEMIREEIGEETFWLGCIAPCFPCVGYADAMRIGGDVGTAWQGNFGPQSMLIETVGNQHLNQVLWQNDPDVLLIRDFHTELSGVEATSLALWQAFMGGVVATSDPLHEISPERLNLWRSAKPLPNSRVAELPFLLQPDRPMTAVRRSESGDVEVLVFNASERRIRDWISLSEIGISGPRLGHQVLIETSSSTPLGEREEFRVDLEPHHCALFRFAASKRSDD